MQAVPFAVDLHGFQFGAARVDRITADKRTGEVVIRVSSDQGEVMIHVTAAGAIRACDNRSAPHHRVHLPHRGRPQHPAWAG